MAMVPYRVDGGESVIKLSNTFISPVAPNPQLYAAEYDLELSYRMMPTTKIDEIAVFKFRHPRAHFFGPPNESSLQTHPLLGRGLESHAGHEVRNSSWIRDLGAAIGSSSSLRHFIFTFQGSTFECVAEGYEVEVKVANA